MGRSCNTVYVNCRFMGRPITGVERFAGSLLDAVHRQVADVHDDQRWVLLIPPSIPVSDRWKGWEIRRVGRLHGHLWEQIDLPRAVRGGLLLNLCNSGPVAASRQITFIHDAAVYDQPDGFSPTYRFAHRALGHLLAKRSHIATVSYFSRDRLAAVFGVPATSIGVVSNAADHLDAIVPDASILADLGLTHGRYLLFVGSFAPNKNLRRALKAWEKVRKGDARFVLVGAAVRSFADRGLPTPGDGIVLPGRLADSQLVALYAHARARVFPSLYEGFGIPPLEAMRFGVPTIASDIPPIREVCDGAALFHDPLDPVALAEVMQRVLDEEALHAKLSTAATAGRDRYSWDLSSKALLTLIRELDA